MSLEQPQGRITTMLNEDCLLRIIKHVGADEEGRLHDLLNLSRTCRTFNKLTRSELYRKLVVYAPRTKDRKASNFEPIIRTLINNPELGKYVQNLTIYQSAQDDPLEEDNWSTTLSYTLTVGADDVGGAKRFFNGEDMANVDNYITELSSSTAFDEYPLGTYNHDGTRNLNRTTAPRNVHYDIVSLKLGFRADNQVVMLTILVSRCQQLKSLKITDWLKLQRGIDYDYAYRPILDSDFLAWLIRGAINTQR